MVLVVATIMFPHAKSSEVAKKNIEMIQRYPPEPDLGEGLALGVKPTIDGMKVLYVGEIKKGKVQEYISRIAKQYQEAALEIEGYTYQIDTYLTATEAYKILGMESPYE